MQAEFLLRSLLPPHPPRSSAHYWCVEVLLGKSMKKAALVMQVGV